MSQSFILRQATINTIDNTFYIYFIFSYYQSFYVFQSVNEIGLIILLISNFCFWKFKKAFQVKQSHSISQTNLS